MDAPNQDPTTGEGDGEVARRVKDYCDQAVANLKAGGFKEAYLFASEALELDENDEKATAIYRYALYTLHPKKRLLDKAETLCEEADQCIDEGDRDHDEALELLSVAKKWHCDTGILWTISHLNFERECFDLAYLNVTEALKDLKDCGGCHFSFSGHQMTYLSYIKYKLPTSYDASNWPKGLRIRGIYTRLNHGYAMAQTMDGETLKPYIPLDQLAQFLNDHVEGAMKRVGIQGAECLTRVLDKVTVPGRLHVDELSYIDGFYPLSWADIERILDGQTLRADTISFTRMMLPSNVDPNKLFEMPVVRGCTTLTLLLHTEFYRPLPCSPPLFHNAALMEWVKRSDERKLRLTRDFLSSGLLSFLDDLKRVFPVTYSLSTSATFNPLQDFLQATEAHSYEVKIYCPGIDVSAGLGVRYEMLSNRINEMMWIIVLPKNADGQFETVFVRRTSPLTLT